MEDHEIPTEAPSEWQPITNKADLAHLGKLGEEICECGASLFRCIIQGVYEAQPVTGKINKEWLEDEIADIQALLSFAMTRFELNKNRIDERIKRKIAYKKPWFDSLSKLD